jgi:protoporphyrinogen oxidase
MGGQKVYNVVWEPLLRGKFGEVASEISAVWFCNKLKLRGGSRGKGGEEQLAYYRGGFAALADQLKKYIELKGGQVITDAPIKELIVNAGQVVGVRSGDITFHADAVIATPALPIIANLVEPHVSADYTQRLRRIRYLGNACLVLELDRSLSNTYWLNVNDPGFPFVGVIEHTNFESVNTYGGRHIVYLSKYLPVSDALFQMSDEDLLEYTIPYLQEMFPAFHRNWILKYHIWKAHYSQPIVERRYSRLIPKKETPLQGLYIATMAQIYPEDRGTNYAVREGRLIGKRLIANISKKTISEGLCERHDV